MHGPASPCPGAIDVGYSAVAGNLSSLPPDTSLATPVEDFATQLEIVRLESGQQSTAIPIPIVDVSSHVTLHGWSCDTREIV